MPSKTGALLVTGSIFFASMLVLRAEEMVKVPKSRLEELERKEAELEKLKGALSKAKDENIQLKQQYDAALAKAALQPPEPAVAHVSPPMASLAPLKPGEVVDAMDLAGHYRTDAAAADQRYGKRTFQVQGEILRFEKPLFTRDYKILLKTADRQIVVSCGINPPETYRAVFTANSGATLIGLTANESRVPLAKVGDTVVIQGQCKGLSDSTVKMARCELKR